MRFEKVDFELRIEFRIPNSALLLAFKGLDAADDFHDLTGNLRLTSSVISPRKVFDHVVRVLCRTLHRNHSSDLLTDRRVEKTLEQFDLEARRNDFFQNTFGRGHELVNRIFTFGNLWIDGRVRTFEACQVEEASR